MLEIEKKGRRKFVSSLPSAIEMKGSNLSRVAFPLPSMGGADVSVGSEVTKVTALGTHMLNQDPPF